MYTLSSILEDSIPTTHRCDRYSQFSCDISLTSASLEHLEDSNTIGDVREFPWGQKIYKKFSIIPISPFE